MTPAQKRLLRIIRLHDDVIRYDTRDGRKRRPLLALERAGLVEFRDDIDDPGRMWAWPKATADHDDGDDRPLDVVRPLV